MRSLVFAVLVLASHLVRAGPPADLVYRNGHVYTVDANDSAHEALAVRRGRIVYVGDNGGAAALVGKATRVVDLRGRTLMPGLIDTHMHPQSGGSRLLDCSLDYQPLTVARFQARIQACLDRDRRKYGREDPQRWLVVVNWFQQGMRPEGVAATAALLDPLRTVRPVLVRSSFGHSALLNARAIALAGIRRDTLDPPGGKIVRDGQGEATGLLEDAAQDLAMRHLPPLSAREHLAAPTAALQAMRRQGITSFLDAWTDSETLTAFATLQRRASSPRVRTSRCWSNRARARRRRVPSPRWCASGAASTRARQACVRRCRCATPSSSWTA